MFEYFTEEEPATPKQVLQIIAEDLRLQNLTYDGAAEKLGYKSKSGLSRMMSGNQYPSDKMAFRMAHVFGYYFKFLTTGVGELRHIDSSRRPSRPGHACLHSDRAAEPVLLNKKLLLLANIVRDPDIQFALMSYLRDDINSFYYFVEKYARVHDIQNAHEFIESMKEECERDDNQFDESDDETDEQE